MIYLHIPEDPAVVGAVGRIALRHGQLDYMLRMTIKSLGGLSTQDALDATARLGSRDLRERIRKLARHRLGEGAPLLRLEAILQRVAKATERRNHLLHTLWAHELNGAPVIRDEDNHLQGNSDASRVGCRSQRARRNRDRTQHSPTRWVFV
ncbi:MAG: hypothetical protein WCB44_00790 [Stellaceae bacterium]